MLSLTQHIDHASCAAICPGVSTARALVCLLHVCKAAHPPLGSHEGYDCRLIVSYMASHRDHIVLAKPHTA